MSKNSVKNEYSPMMTHYRNLKKQYPDCIVFYRLGDFYEMFFEDAVKASAILDLTLTGRDCGREERAPMCGVPYHAADAYIAKLVEHGEKVAICEQLEDPATAKGLVERDVVRIVSAGTITEESLIDDKTSNFLACVYYTPEKCGMAWCDITTGQFFTKKCEGKDKLAELCDNVVRISPSEIICNQDLYTIAADLPIVKHKAVPQFGAFDEREFHLSNAEKTLKEQFGVLSLDAYGISESPELIICCGALISYLRNTQKHALININGVRLERSGEYMTLDANALRNLEIVRNMRDRKPYGTLLWVLDKTNTSMGSRTLNEWAISPLCDQNKINYRLDGVEELYKNAIMRSGLSEQLKCIRDTERLAGKVSNGNVSPKDCRLLGESINAFPNLKLMLFGVSSKILNDINDNIYDLSEIGKLIEKAISESEGAMDIKNGGYIKRGFDEELDRLRDIRQNATSLIRGIEQRERESTGIKNLKIGFNKVFGYYIEVTNSFKDQVPYSYVRKQTLTGAERYITEELKNLEEEVLTSDEKAIKREAEIFAKIKAVLADNIKAIQRSSRAIACLDVLVSFATVAKKNNYCRPEIVASDRALNIVGGRHPVVETVSDEQFVSNDAYLDTDENRVMIITGPNMAGKSTYMRQNALIAIMAHMGSFVPAKSAEIPVIDRIFTRVGASDNLIFDQSTFMVEMAEVAEILLNATDKSLLVLDEVGRGTSTFDGLSIAWAVVEYIVNNIRAKTLFATHYHELSELEKIMEGVKNYKITVRELNGTIVFLRKIMRGSANKSFGIEVAGFAGVPKGVTERAKQILKSLEKNDLTKTMSFDVPAEEDVPEERQLSEVEEIIAATDVNAITPMQALKLIADLKSKVN